MKEFLKRQGVIPSWKTYFITAMGAMAQGLFCTLLVGTILNTIGSQFNIPFLTMEIVSGYTVGGLASAMVGAGIAVAIGVSLKAPPLVMFSLIPIGFSANALGGAGGALAVYLVAIIACECGKLVSKTTKIDILVTPIVTILIGIGLAYLIAEPIGEAANSVGTAVKWATNQQPFLMGIVVSVLVGIALTLPISSAAICAALSRLGRRCCRGRLLRTDGWFCRYELPRKPLGRFGRAGLGYEYAANAQYCEKPPDLDPSDTGICHHRPDRFVCVLPGNERHSRFLRHGHLWLGRPDRCVYRLAGYGREDRRDGLDRFAPDLCRSACDPVCCVLRASAKDRMDQAGRFEARSLIPL